MEKALYINLPDGDYHRMREVAEDARATVLPKPTPLIGGTEVYQKDNGTPYWYCRIKGGRDEFMYLYFGDLTKADLLYDKNGNHREFATDGQKDFKTDALKALKNKPKKGFTWIPVYEPSADGKGNVQYVSGEDVLKNLTSYQWEEILKSYSPENGSHIATITTYFLLLLRWIKDGIATIEQLADDSREIGDFLDRKNDLKKTGEHQFGGLKGFVGNSYKIVKVHEAPYIGTIFSLLGGRCYGNCNKYPSIVLEHAYSPNDIQHHGVGLMELDK